MGIDLNKINLRKEKIFDLKKEKNISTQKSRVVLALDYSGSMSTLYANGVVQETIERILPLGLAFDDDGEVDFYLFENGVTKLPDNITIYNIGDYINKKVIGKYQMRGTNYAPVINEIVKEFGNPSGGWFSSKTSTVDIPTYVIFITDGENFDRNDATSAIKNASNHGIFFQFVGIGSENFNFLQQLDNMSGRTVDNANFFKIPDLSRTSDDDLYKMLLNEFPSWLQEAKSHSLIA